MFETCFYRKEHNREGKRNIINTYSIRKWNCKESSVQSYDTNFLFIVVKFRRWLNLTLCDEWRKVNNRLCYYKIHFTFYKIHLFHSSSILLFLSRILSIVDNFFLPIYYKHWLYTLHTQYTEYITLYIKR